MPCFRDETVRLRIEVTPEIYYELLEFIRLKSLYPVGRAETDNKDGSCVYIGVFFPSRAKELEKWLEEKGVDIKSKD